MNGKTPRLEVALYEYGKSSIPSGEGYIRMIVPLSTDRDRISEELFKLTTNGGDEYCGKVIKTAVQGLSWSRMKGDLRVIFIAGNEPFTQGEVNYEESVKLAASKGITVNTIFCGPYSEGVETRWKDGATLANGKYMNIDQNRQVAVIDAPQDEEILKLGQELNKTYIAYGAAGAEKKDRQKRQDMNAAGLNKEAAVQRSVAKASKQYESSSWDMADAVKSGEMDLDKVKEDELPAEMKKMSKPERKAYVESQIKKRAEIQKRINRLNEDRRVYVDKEMKKRAGESTLDTAVTKTIREQATEKNFKFE
jgi:hypothetical protein